MEREQKERSIFDEFTRKYQLSKTLRFELRPLPATREFLKIDGDAKERIFPKDRERAQNYERLKYYLDLLHRDFINKSLVRFKKEGESIDFETLYEHRGNEGYEEDEREEGNSTEIENVPSKKDALGKARSDIVKSFKENGFLFGKEVINRLEEKFIQEGENILMVNGESKERIPDLDAPCILFTNAEGDEETIFQNFRGFTGYLSGYHENRKNLYKDDRKAGRVVTRIIDQNLPRFFENKDKLNIMLEKYPSLDAIFSNIEAWKDYFKEKELDIKTAIHSFITDGCNWKRVFESDYYNSCFLQQDIQFYNYVIRKLNKDINEYRHKLASEKNKSEGNTSDKKKKLPF
ncbi:MAG: hypothetical protein U1A16_03160, partial [Patescibacteria group bacterium]|nr:hypothetical protein [Patescibacteria group bacterium]